MGSIMHDVRETMEVLGVDERTAFILEMAHRVALASLAGNMAAEIGFHAAGMHAAGQIDAETMRTIWDQIGFGTKGDASR